MLLLGRRWRLERTKSNVSANSGRNNDLRVWWKMRAHLNRFSPRPWKLAINEGNPVKISDATNQKKIFQDFLVQTILPRWLLNECFFFFLLLLSLYLLSSFCFCFCFCIYRIIQCKSWAEGWFNPFPDGAQCFKWI